MRSVLAISRVLEGQVHSILLPASKKHILCARVLNKDVGREYPDGSTVPPEDVGKFWIVLGYSALDGGDVLRP